MRRAGLLVVFALALALAAPAAASDERPTLAELEGEVYCPTCNTLLALSSSPIAERMRAYITTRIAAGDTKSEIEDQLVDQFGEGVLAAPPKRGFSLLAWVLPFVVLAVAAAAVAVLVRRWRNAGRVSEPAAGSEPSPNGRTALDPELERRLDEELARYDG